jgi:hypothetical protein
MGVERLGVDRLGGDRLAAQDLAVRLLHALARLGPELLDEVVAGVAEDGQRLGLPPGPVQREHQLGPQPLPERELADQPGQVGDDPGVVAHLHLDLRPFLPRRRPGLGQPGARRLEDRSAEPGQGVPPPQRQRPAQRLGRLDRAAGPPVHVGGRERGLELLDVHTRLAGAQHVAAAGQREQFARCAWRPIGVEDPAEPGHVFLYDVRTVFRRLVAPHRVDDLVGRHRAAGLQQQDGEHRALLGRAEVDHLGVP